MLVPTPSLPGDERLCSTQHVAFVTSRSCAGSTKIKPGTGGFYTIRQPVLYKKKKKKHCTIKIFSSSVHLSSFLPNPSEKLPISSLQHVFNRPRHQVAVVMLGNGLCLKPAPHGIRILSEVLQGLEAMTLDKTCAPEQGKCLAPKTKGAENVPKRGLPCDCSWCRCVSRMVLMGF